MRLTRTPLPGPARCAGGARRSPCTWRSVTGSTASALSTMPNGAAANLAIGGASPVATSSGKLAALASGRPLVVAHARGHLELQPRVLGSGTRKSDRARLRPPCRPCRTRGASALPSRPTSRTCAASARAHRRREAQPTSAGSAGSGAARSRSQLNSAVKAARTRNEKRCSTVVSTFGSALAAMPRPQTRRTAASPGSGRGQRSSSARAALAPVMLARLQHRRRARRRRSAAPAAARRCPRPRTRRWRRRWLSTAGPFRRSRKCWSSSIVAPSPARHRDHRRPAGIEAERRCARSAPMPWRSGFQSLRSVTVHRLPGGSASAKVVDPDAIVDPAALAARRIAAAPHRRPGRADAARRTAPPARRTAARSAAPAATSPCGLNDSIVVARLAVVQTAKANAASRAIEQIGRRFIAGPALRRES